MVRRFVSWLEHSKTIALTVFTLLVLSLGLSIAVPFFAYAKLHCVSHWADEYTARARSISGFNAERIARLVTLQASEQRIFNAVVTVPFNRDEFLKALRAEQQAFMAYKQADDAATKAAESHPIPGPPKLRC